MSQTDSPQIMEGRSKGRGEQILSMKFIGSVSRISCRQGYRERFRGEDHVKKVSKLRVAIPATIKIKFNPRFGIGGAAVKGGLGNESYTAPMRNRKWNPSLDLRTES